METGFHDEARHTFERKALRNVRDLVDRIEDGEQQQRRRTIRLVAWSIVFAGVVATIAFAILAGFPKPGQQRVIVSPERPAPSQPGGR